MISSSKAGLRGLLFLAEQRPPAGITVGKNTLFYHFSFDRRKTDDGKRWSAKAPFGDRAYFQENPYISNLIIKEVRKEVGRVQLMMDASSAGCKKASIPLFELGKLSSFPHV